MKWKNDIIFVGGYLLVAEPPKHFSENPRQAPSLTCAWKIHRRELQPQFVDKETGSEK